MWSIHCCFCITDVYVDVINLTVTLPKVRPMAYLDFSNFIMYFINGEFLEKYNEPYGAMLVLRTAFFWVIMQRVLVMDPEECSSHLLCCGSMKSYIFLDFGIMHSIIYTEILSPN